MKEFIRTHKAFSFYTSLVLLVVLIALFHHGLRRTIRLLRI